MRVSILSLTPAVAPSPPPQVDPATHTLANEDFCLDGELGLVQCHDLEPFYPVTPYAAQKFHCFAGVEPHGEDALCVAPADLASELPSAQARGRVHELKDSLWPIEAARRAHMHAYTHLEADPDALRVRGGNQPRAAVAVAVAAGAGVLAVVALLLLSARRRAQQPAKAKAKELL